MILDVPVELGEHFYLIKCFDPVPGAPQDDKGESTKAAEPSELTESADSEKNDAENDLSKNSDPSKDKKQSAEAQALAQAYFSFEATAHQLGMTLWGPDSPVVAGEPFAVNIGIKCDGKCSWEGAQGTITTETGDPVATFTVPPLKEDKEKDSFFVAELDLLAPQDLGLHKWIFTLNEQSMAVPHEYVARSFSFATCTSPSATLKLQVLSSKKNEPVNGAFITVKASNGMTYRTRSDYTGAAQLHLPSGEANLAIRLSNYAAYASQLSVEEGEGEIAVTLSYEPDWGA
jgi:hypothetical protein